MKYLFDTHVLIWMFADDKLPAIVDEIIDNPRIVKFISIVSLWEIVIKQNLYKLKLDYNIDEMLDEINNMFFK